jgi:hypothetical protein
MIWQKISLREKLLLLLVLTLLWIIGFRYYYLPVYQKWNYERSIVDLKTSKEETNEYEMNLLREETKDLEDKLTRLAIVGAIEFTVSSVHLFLTQISEICGGVFSKIEMTCRDDQETPNIDINFIWQGDYSELIKSINFFNTLPWVLEEESVLLRKILTSRGNYIQWEYHCKMISKRKDDVQAKELFLLEEESRNPFETK